MEPLRHGEPAGDGRLTLRLIGRLALSAPDGADLTPRHVKAQGILALLGTAPDLRRPRSLVQDRLWSESPPDRGSASLRQTLTGLRQALGQHREALLSEGGWIGLRPDRVRVVLDPGPAGAAPGAEPPEFAAGLDVRDPEFEDWLRDTRAAFAARPAAPSVRRSHAATDPVIAFAAGPCGSGSLAAFADMLAGEAAAMTAGLGGVTAAPAVDAGALRPLMLLEIRAADAPGGVLVQARWRDPGTGAVRAGLRRTLRATEGEDGGPVDMLIAETAFMGASELAVEGDATGDPHALVYGALRSLSTVEPARTAESERLLSRAWSARATAVAAAWRAHIRVAMLIERTARDPQATIEEAAELASFALDRAPQHPIVLAVAAEVALNIEGRPHKSRALAERAVAANPANPLARRTLAHALALTDDTAGAERQSEIALRLAAGWPNLPVFQISRGIMALRAGRFEEAERLALTAHELAPGYKPPLRFLAPLRWRRGDIEGAAAALRALKAIEPDFSLALMESDAYPVASLRGTPLLGVTRSGLL